MLNEDDIAAVVAKFQDAALGRMSWYDAVEGYTAAMGFHHGQLVAFGRDSLVTLNVATGDALAELESFGGHSPDINSRVRVGSTVPELHFLDESDFTTELDIRANEQYADWMERHEVGYSCVTPLIRQNGMLVGLAGLRSKRQEAFRSEEKRRFMSFAAHARAAVTLALALDGTKAQSLAAAMDTMSTPALIYGGSGRIVAMSPGAQTLAAEGRFGRVSAGSFLPHRRSERDRFDQLLANSLHSPTSHSARNAPPMILTGSDGARTIIEFVPLRAEAGFSFTPGAMVIFRGTHTSASRLSPIARELFDLTAAEARLVEYMIDGLAPTAIAEKTGISVGTVRNHIHRILSKSGCNSQLQFLARLHAHCS